MRTLEQRFMSYFEKSDGCWLWKGATDNHGYGVLNDGTGRKRIIRAHRLSWTIFRGNIPKGKFVLHRCDTPLCLNPDHLFLGTQRDNMRDMNEKGRVAKGEKAGPSKLTEEQVRQIKKEYIPSRAGQKGPNGRVVSSQRWLAEKFGVKQSTIGRIVNGQNWSHIK